MKFDKNGLAGVVAMGLGPHPENETVVLLARYLSEGAAAKNANGFAFILANQRRDQLVACAIGIVARIWHEAIIGRTIPWPDQLVVPIGERAVDVRIVRKHLGPGGFDYDDDANLLLISTSRSTVELVGRAVKATNFVYLYWFWRALRRQLRREKPRYSINETPTKAKPRRRVRPGELLPPSDQASLAEGDAVIREIMGQPREEAA